MDLDGIRKPNSSLSIDIGHIIAVNSHMAMNPFQQSGLFIDLERRDLVLNNSRYLYMPFKLWIFLILVMVLRESLSMMDLFTCFRLITSMGYGKRFRCINWISLEILLLFVFIVYDQCPLVFVFDPSVQSIV